MKLVLAAAALAGLVIMGAAARADDTPTKEQQAQAEKALTEAGFKKWEKIEVDGGNFEVDDAVDASGKKFDLRMDGKTMKITSKIAD